MTSIDERPQWIIDVEKFNAQVTPPLIKAGTKFEPLKVLTISEGKTLAEPSDKETIEHMMKRVFRMECEFVGHTHPVTGERTVHVKNSADGQDFKAESWNEIFFGLVESEEPLDFVWEMEIKDDQNGRKTVLIPDFVHLPHKTYVINGMGINKDKRGSNNMDLQTEHLYEEQVCLNAGIWSFSTLCQRLWRLKSHFFDNHYEWFMDAKVEFHKKKSKQESYVTVQLLFDHGS